MFLNCFNITINALLLMWQSLKSKSFEFILTRQFNQEYVENLYKRVSNKETPIQFLRPFKKCLFRILFTQTI